MRLGDALTRRSAALAGRACSTSRCCRTAAAIAGGEHLRESARDAQEARVITRRMPNPIEVTAKCLTAILEATDQVCARAVLHGLSRQLAREVIRLRNETSGASADHPRVCITPPCVERLEQRINKPFGLRNMDSPEVLTDLREVIALAKIGGAT
jgi:hypothetical protein